MFSKKIFLIFALFIFIFFSCGESTYNKVLKKYLYLLKNNQSLNAYQLLSQEDKRIVSLEQYKIDNQSDLSKAVSHYMHYKIISSKLSQTGRAATIKVAIKQINLSLLYSLIPKLLNKSLNYKEIIKIFHANKKYVTKSYRTTKVNYTLIKENDDWKIVANYGEKKTISLLLKEANKFYENDKYKEALLTYKKILEYDNINNKALDKIIEIQEKIDNIKKINLKYQILKTNNNEIKINYNIKNNLSLLVSQIKIITTFLLGNKQIKDSSITVFDSKKNNNTKLGYQESKTGYFIIHNIPPKYDKITCDILSIKY